MPPKIAPRLALIAFFVVQFFFVEVYWTDKTSAAVSLVEGNYRSGTVRGPETPCHYGDGRESVKASWAEEPPVFHFIAMGMKGAGLETLYVRLLPLASTALMIAGILSLLSILLPKAGGLSPFAVPFVLLTPFLYIHAARFLPDVLTAALVAWFLSFFLRKKFALAVLLAFLAVTVKATAIFLVASAWGAYWLLSADRRSLKIGRGFLLAAAALPTLAWLKYLQLAGIENPFFATQASFGNHMGGSDLALLWSGKYWTRFFTWVVLRGVSIPLFVGFLVAAYRYRRAGYELRFLLIAAAGVVPYWMVVRNAQYPCPWYSFPFLVPMAAVGIAEVLKARHPAWRWATLAALLAISVPKLTYFGDPARGYGFPLEHRPTLLQCEPTQDHR